MGEATLYFEDFLTGAEFESAPREISREDIDQFAGLSGDLTDLHTDERKASQSPLGGIVAHGALNLAVATGLAYELGIFDGSVLAFRSLTASFDRPVYPGDHVQLQLVVASADPPHRADRGTIKFEMALQNQNGRRVVHGAWTLVLRRRPQSGQHALDVN